MMKLATLYGKVPIELDGRFAGGALKKGGSEAGKVVRNWNRIKIKL